MSKKSFQGPSAKHCSYPFLHPQSKKPLSVFEKLTEAALAHVRRELGL